MGLRCCATAVASFIIAFFFFMVMNHALHDLLPPCVNEMAQNCCSAFMLVMLLFGTGFMDKLKK